MNKNNYVVYLLVNTSHNKTYLGITNNFKQRLRKHNEKLRWSKIYH